MGVRLPQGSCIPEISRNDYQNKGRGGGGSAPTFLPHSTIKKPAYLIYEVSLTHQEAFKT